MSTRHIGKRLSARKRGAPKASRSRGIGREKRAFPVEARHEVLTKANNSRGSTPACSSADFAAVEEAAHYQIGRARFRIRRHDAALHHLLSVKRDTFPESRGRYRDAVGQNADLDPADGCLSRAPAQDRRQHVLSLPAFADFKFDEGRNSTSRHRSAAGPAASG